MPFPSISKMSRTVLGNEWLIRNGDTSLDQTQIFNVMSKLVKRTSVNDKIYVASAFIGTIANFV